MFGYTKIFYLNANEPNYTKELRNKFLSLRFYRIIVFLMNPPMKFYSDSRHDTRYFTQNSLYQRHHQRCQPTN